ncbi:MAG: YbjQ family protein, partial [Akkermansia sp.]
SDIMASLKTLVGGEITQYSQLMNDTRALAIERMQENAQAMGANAVIGLRFASSEIGQGLSELLAYGTAVVLRPEP